MLRKALVFILIVICLFLPCGDSPIGRELALDKVLGSAAENYGIPAISAVFARDGETIYASRNTDNLYGIGSISKSFVAALALKLQEEGILRLADTIGQYLPDFPHWNKDSITLRDLLSMRSGIGDYTENFEISDYFKDYTRDELLEKGIRNSALLSKGDFAYSNTNILIARQMIEKAAGKDCEDLIREKILAPLRLNNTFFASVKESIRCRITSGYSKIKNGERLDCTNTSSSWADLACGMYSTSSDMARWGFALLCGGFLSDVSKQELTAFQPIREGSEYALCIARKIFHGKEAILLSGNVPGYNAVIIVQENTVCAVLCNLSDYTGGGISYTDEIAKALLSKIANK